MIRGNVAIASGRSVTLRGMVRGQVINQGGTVDYAARPSGD